IAAQELNNPFEYCDVVTTTTHKTLRGPRAGLIFRKDLENAADLEKHINDATIAAIATSLLQVSKRKFKLYAKQVIANARALAASLVSHGYRLQTDSTNNHLVLWDLRPIGLTGSKVEKGCDLMGITINKNAVSGDASAQVPGGIRLGTSALTLRNMKEEDIKVVADFLHCTVQLSLLLQKEAGSKLLKDFVRVVTVPQEGLEGYKQVKQLRDKVVTFASQWPLPGVDVQTLMKPEGIHDCAGTGGKDLDFMSPLFRFWFFFIKRRFNDQVLTSLDTGIDYNHPTLGGGIGSNFLVIGSYDFVGDAYDGSNTSTPDSDPHDNCQGAVRNRQ
ncbi:hypothetical protein CVT25_008596, partial [Psilocybe cyanescens]